MLKNILLFLICSGLVVGSNTNAAIIGGTDYEDGLQVADSPFIRSHGNTNIIVQAENGVTPRSGSWMQRTYLNRLTSTVMTYRSESQVIVPYSKTQWGSKILNFDKGKEYWLGISIFIPANWDMNYVNGYSGGIIFQFHDKGFNDPKNCGSDGASFCWRHTLPLTLMHQETGFVLRNHGWYNGYNPGNYKYFEVTTPYKLGQWTDFVANFKFSGNISKDDNNGFIRVWADGKLIYEREGQNFFGEQPEGAYFQYGIYNWGWREQYRTNWVGPDERLLYHDEVRFGDANSSYDEVAPPKSVVFKPNPPTGLK